MKSEAQSGYDRSPSYSHPHVKREAHSDYDRPPSSSHPLVKRENPEPSKCLGVFGLCFETTEERLEREFSHYGHIEQVKLVIDGESKRSRGFGFVYYDAVESATAARAAMNGAELEGFKIRVDYSLTKEGHKPTPGIYYKSGQPVRPKATRGGVGTKRGGVGGGGDVLLPTRDSYRPREERGYRDRPSSSSYYSSRDYDAMDAR